MITEINLSKMIPAALLAYPDVIRAVIPDIAEATRTEIIRLAGARLGVSSDDYIQGIQPVQYHFPSGRVPEGEHVVASIALVGWLPNALEHGWSGGDMKPALLAGRSARHGSRGAYTVVPFRHGVPGGSNRNFQKMGSAHVRTGAMTAEQGRKMGQSIHRAAKKLGPGDRLGAGHSPKLRPHHTTDIHHGMERQTKQYKSSQGSQYITFRAVSLRSDGWIHPGIEAHRLFDEAGDYAGKITGHLLDHAMRGVNQGTQ